MKKLSLQFFDLGDASAKKVVTLPLNTLQLSLKLLPTEVRSFLEQEEIELSGCRDLIKERSVVGTLIEIATPSRRLIVSVDTGEGNSRRAQPTVQEGSNG